MRPGNKDQDDVEILVTHFKDVDDLMTLKEFGFDVVALSRDFPEDRRKTSARLDIRHFENFDESCNYSKWKAALDFYGLRQGTDKKRYWMLRRISK